MISTINVRLLDVYLFADLADARTRARLRARPAKKTTEKESDGVFSLVFISYFLLLPFFGCRRRRTYCSARGSTRHVDVYVYIYTKRLYTCALHSICRLRVGFLRICLGQVVAPRPGALEFFIDDRHPPLASFHRRSLRPGTRMTRANNRRFAIRVHKSLVARTDAASAE